MRVPAAFLLALAAILTPSLGTADPAQPQPMTATAPATPAQPPKAAPSATSAAPVGGAPTPVSAATPAQSAAERVLVHGKAQNDDVAASLNAIVCHTEPPPTGSRLGGARKCYTLRQWNDRQKSSHAIIDGIQMRGLSEGYGH